jgi:hypothetical protein
MLGILAGFGEIGIGIFEHGILIAVAELAFHADVAPSFGIFSFDRAFGHVLIGLLIVRDGIRHDSTSFSEIERDSLFSEKQIRKARRKKRHHFITGTLRKEAI